MGDGLGLVHGKAADRSVLGLEGHAMTCPYEAGSLANLLSDFPQHFNRRKYFPPGLLAHYRAQPRRQEPHFLPQLLIHKFSDE